VSERRKQAACRVPVNKFRTRGNGRGNVVLRPHIVMFWQLQPATLQAPTEPADGPFWAQLCRHI